MCVHAHTCARLCFGRIPTATVAGGLVDRFACPCSVHDHFYCHSLTRHGYIHNMIVMHALRDASSYCGLRRLLCCHYWGACDMHSHIHTRPSIHSPSARTSLLCPAHSARRGCALLVLLGQQVYRLVRMQRCAEQLRMRLGECELHP